MTGRSDIAYGTNVVSRLERNMKSRFRELASLKSDVSLAENEIELECRSVAFQGFKVSGAQYGIDDGGVVRLSGQQYCFSCAVDNQVRSTFSISLTPLTTEGDSPPSLIERIHSVDGVGLFREVAVLAPRELAREAHQVAEAVSVVICFGYGWIQGQIEEVCSLEENSLTAELYSELHKIIEDKELRKNLWFAMIGEHRGFRLLDPSVVNAVFPLVNKFARRNHLNTLQMVAELVSTQLPREGLLMNEARKQASVVDGQIKNAKYSTEEISYAAVMRGLYDDEAFAILPIITHPNRSVFLLFPSDNSWLRDHLGEQIGRLERICDEANSQLDAAISRFDVGEGAGEVLIEPTNGIDVAKSLREHSGPRKVKSRRRRRWLRR